MGFDSAQEGDFFVQFRGTDLKAIADLRNRLQASDD
jgi:hypothetical protein